MKRQRDGVPAAASCPSTSTSEVQINSFSCVVECESPGYTITLYPEVYFGPFVLLRNKDDGTVYLPGPDGSICVPAGGSFDTVKFVSDHIVVAGRLEHVDVIPPTRVIGTASFLCIGNQQRRDEAHRSRRKPCRSGGFAYYVRHRCGVDFRVSAAEWNSFDDTEKERWRRLAAGTSPNVE